MSLRNELRASWNVTDLYYNWDTMVGNMSAAAGTIHEANPDILITWSGMQYDEDLSALTAKKNILTAPCYQCDAVRDALRRDPVYFDLDSYPFADKIVWELHLYPMSNDRRASRVQHHQRLPTGTAAHAGHILRVRPRPGLDAV
jgi:endoglucanase